ncbi:hypothetical protein, partial, partial [Absidia glauca]
MNPDQKIDKMAEDMIVIMNNSARILSELTSLRQRISGNEDAVREMATLLAGSSGARPEPTPVTPIPSRAVPIPPLKQKKGARTEKQFKPAIIDLIRSEWKKSPVEGAPDKTEQDIQEAYATIVDWTAEIVQGIAPSLYREGKILW